MRLKRAWLLNTKELRSLKEEEYREIEGMPQVDGYEQLEFEGKPSIAMALDMNSITKRNATDESYRIATHELIHFYYQTKASGITENSNRSQVFPVDKTPRIYRMMIFQNLIRAYEKPEQESEFLGKVKYWLEKWKNEFTGEYEAIKATDIAESTARYAENIGTFISQETTEEQFRMEALKNIPRDKVFYSADAESYEIGYVAALILDKKMPGWKDNFYNEDITAEEKLVKDVDVVTETVDPNVEADVSKAIETYNKGTEESIKDLIKARKDTNIPYLKLDISDSLSSMSASGMLVYDGKQVITEYSNRFSVDGKSIEVSRSDVFEEVDADYKQYLIIPLTMPHELTSDVLTVNSDTLKVDGIKIEVSEENGRKIYSAKTGK